MQNVHGRPRRLWDDNIKVDVTQIVRKNVNWIQLPLEILLVADNFGRAEGKHCFGACAAVRLLS
jgi:hypothetical protein